MNVAKSYQSLNTERLGQTTDSARLINKNNNAQ